MIFVFFYIILKILLGFHFLILFHIIRIFVRSNDRHINFWYPLIRLVNPKCRWFFFPLKPDELCRFSWGKKQSTRHIARISIPLLRSCVWKFMVRTFFYVKNEQVQRSKLLSKISLKYNNKNVWSTLHKMERVNILTQTVCALFHSNMSRFLINFS